MDHFPKYHKRQHSVGRKPSPYEGRRLALRLSTAYIQSPKVHINNGTPRVTFDHDDDPRRRRTSRDNRGFMFNDSTLVDDDSSGGNEPNPDLDSDEPFFHWEEESTLLSELMQEGPKNSVGEYLDALADSLQVPFTEQGKFLKREIAETLVSTNNNIKSVFRALEKNVDASYGQGLVLFNNTCKEIEGCVSAQQADFWDSYETTKVQVENAFEELKREYAERNKLWDKLFNDLDDIVAPTLETIKTAPARVENTILRLEKHAKSLENDSRSINSVEKGIQDLLSTS